MKHLCFWKNYLLVKNFLGQGKILVCGKRFCLLKKILIKEDFWLVRDFLVGKHSWSRKNICLWETSMVKEKSLLKDSLIKKKPWLVGNFHDEGKLFVENFLYQEKILACGKIFCLWKTSLIKEKCWHIKNVFACGKTSWLGIKIWLVEKILTGKLPWSRKNLAL